jgi:aspartyl-tRNA synthetase
MPASHRGVTTVHRLLARMMLLRASGSVGGGRQAAACLPAATAAAPARLAVRSMNNIQARLLGSRATTTMPCAATAASPAAPAAYTPAPGEVTRDMVWAGRTADAGTLTPADIGRKITVAGWVHRARALGGKTFVDVRDATGLLQIVSPDEAGDAPAAAAAALERLRAEFVVQVTGTLRLRKDPNPKMPTGGVELVAEQVRGAC